MTEFQFEEGMQRLISMYGVKAYPSERKQIIFEKVKALSSHEWNIVVKTLIANSRYAPMLDDVLKASRSFIERANAQESAHQKKLLEERKANGLNCQYCGDTGVISAWRRETAYSFSFRCPDKHCTAAEFHGNSRDVHWSDEYLKEYMPVFDNESSSDVFEKASPNWIAERDLRTGKTKPVESDNLAENVVTMLRQEPEKAAAIMNHQRDAHKKVLERFDDGTPIEHHDGRETNTAGPEYSFDGPF